MVPCCLGIQPKYLWIIYLFCDDFPCHLIIDVGFPTANNTNRLFGGMLSNEVATRMVLNVGIVPIVAVVIQI